MRIESLRLKGFTGVKKGLGIDEIALDLSELSGLVALAGPNGHGKTTVLDNMHPFRQLASRKKSLNHHVCRRDSEKELSFMYNGDFYRTLLRIDSDSDRSEGFVWKNDRSEVDGKVSSYDKYITDLLGSPALFFNSVFCAQNADKLSDLTAGDVKKLFAEFLRLDRFIAWENTCKQAGSVLTGNMSRIERSLHAVESEMAAKATSLTEIPEAKQRVFELAAQLETAKTALATLREREPVLQVQAGISAQIEQELATVKKDYYAAMAAFVAEEQRAKKEIDALDQKIAAAQAKVQEHSGIIAQRCDILKAVEEVRSFETDISKILQKRTEKMEEALKRSAAQLACRARYSELRSTLDRLKTAMAAPDLVHEISACRERMADLCKKDPDCKSQTCSFIVKALEAERRLPELEEKFNATQKTAAAEIDTVKKQFNETEAQGRALAATADQAKEELAAFDKWLNDLNADLQRHKKLAGLLPKLQAAEASIEALKAQIEEAKAALQEAEEAHSDRKLDLGLKKEDLFDRIRALEAKIQPNAQANLDAIRKEIKTAEAYATEKWELLTANRNTLACLEADALRNSELAGQRAELYTQRQTLNSEMAEWIYLKNACGPNGLRALEIDSVAPCISGYANDLLHGTFGPNYSVRLQTQDPESGREVLDILAIREDGSEVLLDNLSGGEKVWSLKALRLAMTLITQERSGRHYETLLCDEEDGALSEENAVNFIRLYRSLMATAGMSTCFFISHKPECVAMADCTMRFSKGGITIAA